MTYQWRALTSAQNTRSVLGTRMLWVSFEVNTAGPAGGTVNLLRQNS